MFALPNIQRGAPTCKATESFSNLSIALLKIGYHTFEAIGLCCCGYWRICLTAGMTPTHWPCPICRRERECFPIARGITRGELPAPHRACAPIKWDVVDGLLVDAAPAPTKPENRHCKECGCTFEPRHGSQKLCNDLCAVIRASRRAAKRYAQKTAALAVSP